MQLASSHNRQGKLQLAQQRLLNKKGKGKVMTVLNMQQLAQQRLLNNMTCQHPAFHMDSSTLLAQELEKQQTFLYLHLRAMGKQGMFCTKEHFNKALPVINMYSHHSEFEK